MPNSINPCHKCFKEPVKVTVKYQGRSSYQSVACLDCRLFSHASNNDNWSGGFENWEARLFMDTNAVEVLDYPKPKELTGPALFVKLQEEIKPC